MQHISMRRRAFTLVEALVAIAVIALLVGLLAPALSSVGANSRSLRCQSNLRQMAAAAHNYAALYEAFPPALLYERRSGTIHRVAWDWVTSFNDELISPGPLWSFTNNPGDVQQCPDFHGSATYSSDPHTGYNYNTSYIGAESPSMFLPGWSHARRGVPPHACSRGDRCAMFGDGGWKSGANKFMRAPLQQEWSLDVLYGGGQAFRHMHSTNIAFVDGHIGAANTPHKGKHATQELLDQIMDFPRNGFLSDDDSFYNPR